MRAFYFEKPSQQVDPGGDVSVGGLDLDAGKYVLFAKADIGTPAHSTSFPPQAGGVLKLSFGGGTDEAIAALKPEDGDNIETVSLMLAAETDGPTYASLEFQNPYALTIALNEIRLVALQVDDLIVRTSEGS